MVRRGIWIVTINVLVFCVLAEALALLVYSEDTGRLFYTYRKPYDPIAETREGRLTAEGLHPYFGPSHRAGSLFDIPQSLLESPPPTSLTTNNFGFLAVGNYPFVKTNPRQFVIGIFGGSVGVWFCQIGTNTLLHRLQQNAFFKDKELIPLCFSHEGYKQPQQLLVLTYFLSIGQQFDLVVNIDGFNEVALSNLNDQRGLDISMPSVMHLDPLVNLINQSTLTPEKLQSLAEISQYKQRVNALIERLQRTRSAAVGFVLQRLYRSALNSYRAEVSRFATLTSNPSTSSLLLPTASVESRDQTRLFEDVARSWAASSALMNTELAAHGVPYFHVLQPNQYFTSRTFTDEERRVALNDASSFRAGAEKGYPVLVTESTAGALKTVNFFNAVDIFDHEQSAVYMDDCCHYTLRGNQLLAESIARQILTSQGPWR